MIGENARELERLMVRRRALCSQLLSLDSYDRWGNPDDEQREELQKEMGKAIGDEAAVRVELDAAVARLRIEYPEDVIAWATAHVGLLEHYMKLHGEKTTEHFVAKREHAEWNEVIVGARAFVEESVTYVRQDRDLYREIFGFDP